MKVTVCFENVKVVVPCGQGDMFIRDLARMAILRYQKSVASTSQSQKPCKSGPMLNAVISPEYRPGPRSEQNLASAEKEFDISERSLIEVEALTLARDGGILDWDDRVVDVLDDREMLIAHIQNKQLKSDTGSDQSSPSISCPNTTTNISVSIMSDLNAIRCNGDNTDRQTESQILAKNSQSQLSQRSVISQVPPIISSSRNQPISNQPLIASNNSIFSPGQVKEIIKQWNFEPQSTPSSAVNDSYAQGQSAVSQFPITSQTPPPPPPLRFHKLELLDSVEYGTVQMDNNDPDISLAGHMSTFRGPSLNTCTSMRINRPAPPPPPPHLKKPACQETGQYGDDQCIHHPGGLLAHVADTMCPTSLSAEQFNQRYIGVDNPVSSSPEVPSSCNADSTELKDLSRLTSNIPPPLQLSYPPGALLPTFPFPSIICTSSSTQSTSSYMTANPLSLMDNSTLSTVPEEDLDPLGSMSDQSTPPQTIHSFQTKVAEDLTGQSDAQMHSSATTSTMPSTLSNSKQRPLNLESDGLKLSCSVDPMVDSKTSLIEPKLQSAAPSLPSEIPPPVTAILTPRSTTQTAPQVSSASQSALSTAHDRPVVIGSRQNRKMKRRRLPRPPPPPPPSIPPFREIDSHSGSASGSDSDEPPVMDNGAGHETHTICRRPMITGSVPKEASTPVDLNSRVTCKTSVADTEALEHTLGASLDLRNLDRIEATLLTKFVPETSANSNTTPNPPTPLSAHWSNTTDCVPGYTPEELAEAEHSLQQLEESQHRDSHPQRERQFSLDEDRILLMKPAPPKRSPLTTLTGFSFLTPSNHLSALEAYDHRSTGNVCSGGGRHLSGDSSGGGGQFKDSGGSGSSQGDVDGYGDDFRSARSSDTAHDAVDNVDDDDGHDTSSLTGDELVNEQQRRAAAAEDEVLHMTELLSKRRESEARRHLMMAELEADMERDHRLREAATAMALAAVSNLSPSRRSRVHRYHTHSGRCSRHSRNGMQPTSLKGSITTRDQCVAFREEDMLISITKTPSGLGFSLTTKPLKRDGNPRNTGEVSGKELGAICVKNILPGGAALKEGKLRLGDRLLRVDDQDVSDKTQAEVVSILRVKPVGSVVQLLVRRQIPILDTATLPRNLPIGFTCPSCLIHNSAVVKPCPDYTPYVSMIPNNLKPVCHDEYPPRLHMQPQSQRQKQNLHRQKLMEEFAHRTHSQYPVCHTPQATKLQCLAVATGVPDRTGYRCASPPLPQRIHPLLDDLPDVTSMTNYPPYPDVMIFRLNIPLVNKTTVPEAVMSSTTPTSMTSTSTANTDVSVTGVDTSMTSAPPVSRHMRLGVSVRETNSSRATKLAERLRANADQSGNKCSRVPSGISEEYWVRDLGADSVYGGVLVKGIIEGGAAHQDGRLRVGDELLEVNGVPLVNASSPLGLLRSVLRQLTSSPPPPPTTTAVAQISSDLQKSDIEESIIQVSRANSRPRTEMNVVPLASKPTLSVELLTARQLRHRRSASGHTLASNSELWAETYPGNTTATTTTTCQTSTGQTKTIRPGLPSTANGEGLQLLSNPGIDADSGDCDTRGSRHAMQIAADVHLHRCSTGEELILEQANSATTPNEKRIIPHGSGKFVIDKPLATTTSSDASTRITK